MTNLVQTEFQFKYTHTRARAYYPVTFIWLWNLDIKMWDIRRLKTAEMKSIRRTAGCSLLDHRRNEDNLEEPSTV